MKLRLLKTFGTAEFVGRVGAIVAVKEDEVGEKLIAAGIAEKAPDDEPLTGDPVEGPTEPIVTVTEPPPPSVTEPSHPMGFAKPSDA